MGKPQDSASFAWSGKLRTNHVPPRTADLRPDRDRAGRRRVAIIGDWANAKNVDWPTTYIYNEDGTIDGDTTGEWRLVSA